MKNQYRYKTAQERAEAFCRFCSEINHNDCEKCPIGGTSCKFEWLDLQCEEEMPLPCPFCGSKTVWDRFNDIDIVRCVNCLYHSSGPLMNESAIAAHNRVAKAAMKGETK